jgi:hypothetical protein
MVVDASNASFLASASKAIPSFKRILYGLYRPSDRLGHDNLMLTLDMVFFTPRNRFPTSIRPAVFTPNC